MSWNKKPKLRVNRYHFDLTDEESAFFLRLSAKLGLKRAEVLRRALFEYAKAAAGGAGIATAFYLFAVLVMA